VEVDGRVNLLGSPHLANYPITLSINQRANLGNYIFDESNHGGGQ
jgi:hypothetical protein